MYIVFDNSEMSPLVPKPIVSRKAILEAFGNIFPVNLNIILIRNIVKNSLTAKVEMSLHYNHMWMI